MNNQITSRLSEIDTAKKIIKKTIFRSCSDSDTNVFSTWLQTHFPSTILDNSNIMFFSRIADGLNYNGLFIYSLIPDSEHSIYEANSDWWTNECQKKYLFLADDSISWYCVDPMESTYWILDKPSGEIVSQCKTFDELILTALNTALS